MATNYATRKATPTGKATTLARRNARAGKRTPTAALTRSGHMRARSASER